MPKKDCQGGTVVSMEGPQGRASSDKNHLFSRAAGEIGRERPIGPQGREPAQEDLIGVTSGGGDDL